MRELLNELEAGSHLSHADPLERARAQMRTPRPRRFYAEVDVVGMEEGFAVRLDEKFARTPGRAVLALPTESAARLAAGEFSTQKDVMDLPAMPVVRLANTAIDGVASDPQAVMEDILRFASCDLVCYRADAPRELMKRQAEAWDPVIDWACAAIPARFMLAEGVMHVDQPREALGAVGAYLNQRGDTFRLAALHVMTALTGSALLALAVEAGEIEPDAAWDAAHIDEDWNIEQWGEDGEASIRRANRCRDMMAAAALIRALD